MGSETARATLPLLGIFSVACVGLFTFLYVKLGGLEHDRNMLATKRAQEAIITSEPTLEALLTQSSPETATFIPTETPSPSYCPSLENLNLSQDIYDTPIQEIINTITSNPDLHPYPAWRLGVLRDHLTSIGVDVNGMTLREALNQQVTYYDPGTKVTATPFEQVCTVRDGLGYNGDGLNNLLSQNPQFEGFGNHDLSAALNSAAGTLFSAIGTAAAFLSAIGIAYTSYSAIVQTGEIYGPKQVPKKAFEALVIPYAEAGKDIVNFVRRGIGILNYKPESMQYNPKAGELISSTVSAI